MVSSINFFLDKLLIELWASCDCRGGRPIVVPGMLMAGQQIPLQVWVAMGLPASPWANSARYLGT